MNEASHVICEVLHPDPGLGPHQTNAAYEGAAHVVGLCAEDMFHPDPNGGFGPVAALGLLGQRLAPLALAVDVTFHFSGAQLRLHLFGAIGLA